MAGNKSGNKYEELMEYCGVEFTDSSSDQLIGTCLFCDKEQHFFVNKEHGAWDCKSCGKSGGPYDFLALLFDELKLRHSQDAFKRMYEYRGLPPAAFEGFEYACFNGKSYFPTRNIKNQVIDIRNYVTGNKLKSTKHGEHDLYNIRELLDQDKTDTPVYIVESLWGHIALSWLFKQTGKKAVIVSLPGANGFKKEWGKYFVDREVIILLDNDPAGADGTSKIYEIIAPVVKSIKKIDWGVDFPTKFDINDFVTAYAFKKGNPTRGLMILDGLIKPFGLNEADEIRKELITESVKKEISKGFITLKTAIAKYEEFIDVNDEIEQIIKICLATVLSVQIKGSDPVWTFLEGPPGWGKTLILSSLKDAHCCYFLSSLRKSQLISGFKTADGVDPSILAKLFNRCFVLKDYTEVLAKSKFDRDEIFGILRGAFDGDVDRDFGNGVVRRYPNLHFSMLAGVTNEIRNHSQGSLGERFLRFNIDISKMNADAQQDAAFRNAISGDDNRDELRIYIKEYLNQDFDFSRENVKSKVPNWFIQRLKPLARLVAHIRTPVSRHQFGYQRDEVMYEPQTESGNRIGIQLQRLAITLAILENKLQIDEEIYQFIKRVAFDTVVGYQFKVLKLMHTMDHYATKNDLASGASISRTSVKTYLDNLIELNLVTKGKTIYSGEKHKPTETFILTPYVLDLWSKV